MNKLIFKKKKKNITFIAQELYLNLFVKNNNNIVLNY